MVIGERTIYAVRQITQVVGRDRRARRGPGSFTDGFPQSRDAYHFASISPRTKSSHLCRLRISANLSPRISTSADNGREL